MVMTASRELVSRHQEHPRSGFDPYLDRRPTHNITIRLHRHGWIGAYHEMRSPQELHPGMRPEVFP